MKRVLAGLAVLLFSTSASAQGITGIFRSVTNALQGGGQPAPQQQGATPVIGVRGMDQADEAAAAPAASEDYTLMEGWAATKPEAETQARKTGLASRTATLGQTEPAAAAAETNAASQ